MADEECFVEIAINTPFKETADEAIGHIEKESSFIQILRNAKLEEVRKETLSHIDDIKVLIEIIKENEDAKAILAEFDNIL